MTYICTHTDFNEYISEGDYSIISSTPLSNSYSFPVILSDNELIPLQVGYAEGYMIYDIWKKHSLNHEWIGINHYRRYFDYVSDTTILPTPLSFNMNLQYQSCHNINDLLQIESIIDTYYPSYHLEYSSINIIYPCNMFVLSNSDFNAYCEFVFSVLDIFNKHKNLHSDNDNLSYVTNNAYMYLNKDFKYQSRLQGFLMERIGTIFFINHFKDKPVYHQSINVVSSKKTK